MALMFPRIARNYSKAGFYPTDELTLERIINALDAQEDGLKRVLDPCAGEGHAIMETAHRLGKESTEAYAVEFDADRAEAMRKWVDCGVQADLFDTVISPRSFSLLWLNPPYGDLVTETQGATSSGKGRQRLEKRFYQRTVHDLQYGGVMVLIVPHYSLDKELSGWISHHFESVQVFRGAVDTFKQVVVIGVRKKRNVAVLTDDIRRTRDSLRAVGEGSRVPDVIPEALYGPNRYHVPAVQDSAPPNFYRVSLEPVQMAQEIGGLDGMWQDFNQTFGTVGVSHRPPLRQLSQWHLALSLAAGAISGVIESPHGRRLVVKGDTFKEKTSRTEFSEDEDGNVTETLVLTDRFVPVIKAWDLTPGSPALGTLLTITSRGEREEGDPEQGDVQTDASDVTAA
ncbi:DUF6094 domain-containing protein [Carnimonas bestiolae]|uniref:DUF6094 domain-containing protein n=1 Tax=Carnimonas bestiolae TaxID=3402172 RepID=UPI003EDBA8D2